MKTKINHAGREFGSKKLLAVLAVLAVTLVVLAVVPSAVSGDDQASEVVTPESLGLPAAVEGVVTLQESKEVTLTKNVTLELKTIDLNGQALSIKSSSDTEKYTLTLKSTDAKSELLANRSAEGVATIFVKGAGLALKGLAPAEGDKGASLIHMGDGSTSKLGVYIGVDKSNFTIETLNSKISTIQTSKCNTVFEFSNESKFTYKGGSVQNVGFVFTNSEADMTASIDGTSVAGYWNLENSTVKVKDACIYAAKLMDSTFDASGFVGLYTKEGGVNQFAQTETELVELELCKAELFGDSNIKAGELRCNFPSTTGTVPFVFNGNPADTDEETSVVQKVEGNLRFYDRGDNGVVAENGIVNKNGFRFNNVLFSGTALHVADGVTNEVEFKNVNCGFDGLSVSLGSIVVGGDISESESEIIVNSGVAKLEAGVPRGVTVTVKSGAKLIVEERSTIRVDGTIKIEKGGEMQNSGTLSLADRLSVNFGQTGDANKMGRFVHIPSSTIVLDNSENQYGFMLVDSHYKLKDGFFYKVRMQNFGPHEDVWFGIRDIAVKWNGVMIDEERLQDAGAEVIPLIDKSILSVIGLSYSPVLNEGPSNIVDPGYYPNAVKAAITLTYAPENQANPQTRNLNILGDLEVLKADFSSELVTVTPGPNPIYTGNDLKDQFTFDVKYTINGNESITIPPAWYKPIFNVKDPNGGMQPVEEVVDAGKYWVQLEATPENEIFQGMTEPVEVEVLKATTSIKLEDTTDGKFWTAMAYKPGMIRITPVPLATPITATATIEGQNPIIQEIGENDGKSAQENLDAMLNNASLNHKAGMTYKIKVEIKETDNTTGSEAELQITVGKFVKLDDYLTVEAVNISSDNVSSKTNVKVEEDPENEFRYNASGPVERDSQAGGYIFYLQVTAHDFALMNQSGENGCGVEFEGSDGVEIEESFTDDGKYARLEVKIKKLPMGGIITITATPNGENLSLLPATYTVDLSGLYPAELRIVFHDEYNTVTFTENLIAYILDKLKDGDGNPSATAQELRDLLQFEIGDYFLLPAPSDGKQWKLSYIGSNDEPVDQYYAGNSIYVIKEEHIDATNAIHFWAANAPDAPQPETGNVVFVFGDEVEIRTMELGTLSIPDDIAEAATKPGFTYVWKYNGVEISGETQVVDGMILIAEYTEEPVTTGDVTFVYGTNAVTRPIEFGTLSVPEDVDTEAQMDGYTHIWTYMGTAISEETEVVDGMVVVAVYTAIPVEPTTGDVTFGFGGISITRAMEFGTLTVPADIDAAAKKNGYTHIWTYNGAQISEETQVVDGMIVIAEYTAIPVDPTTGKVIFVFGGVGVTKTLNLGTLEVPEDVNAAAQKEGYDLDWTYNGVKIDAETQVVDGMVVVAVYTLIHVEPTTGDVTFVYDGTAVVKTLDLGTLVVPQDVNDAAQKDGYDLAWMYDGNVISGQTQVKDGMIVVAVYTPIPVEPTTGDVTFVYDGTAVVKTLDLGTLVVPQDVNDAAQKDGYDLAWTYKGEKINAETQVEDGMVIVAVYTETPVPVEYSTNMIVALKVVDGKIFYTIVAVDGKAVPAGTLDISYAYEVDLGEYGTSVDFGLIKVEITNENGSEYVSGSVDLPEGALSAYAVFTYDGGSESTPVYNK